MQRRAVAAAAVYCRISSDVEETGLGVARQEHDCRALAGARGWPVAEVYVDNDVSAYDRRRRRPAYARMMADLRDGTRDAVVAYHLDRLYRQPRELEDLIDLCEDGAVAFAAVAGEVDLAESMGRTMARIAVAMANQASADTSRRIRRKLVEVAGAGRPHGGRRPYGYANNRMTLVPGEVAVIREAVERILAGASVRSVVVDLHRRGITTSTGAAWDVTPFRRMLLRPRMIGLREHKGSLTPATWPAIITPDEQVRLRALFADPARVGPGAAPKYLLSGLLRCGMCGTRMHTHVAHGRSKRTYLCPAPPRGCLGVSVVADASEAFIEAAILGLGDARALDLAARRPDVDPAEAVAASRARLEALAADYGAGDMTREEWQAARRPLLARLEASMRDLADQTEASELGRLVGDGERLRDLWPEWDVDQRRAALAAVLDHVVVRQVNRGRTFNPARLDPVWKA